MGVMADEIFSFFAKKFPKKHPTSPFRACVLSCGGSAPLSERGAGGGKAGPAGARLRPAEAAVEMLVEAGAFGRTGPRILRRQTYSTSPRPKPCHHEPTPQNTD